MKLHYKKNRSAVPYTCGRVHSVGGRVHSVGGRVHSVGGRVHSVGGRVHSVGGYMKIHYKKNKSVYSYTDWQKRNLTPNFRLT